MINEIKYTYKGFFNNILLILLFLFSLNFFNRGGYILCLMISILLLKIIITKEKIRLSNKFIIMILFSMSYFLIYIFHFGINFKYIIYFFVGPIGIYLFGASFIKESNTVNNLEKLILASTMGMFSHGTLNMILTIKEYGIFNSQRVSIDIWRRDLIAATGQGMYFSMLCGIFFSYVLVKQKNKFMKIIIIISMLFSLFTTLELANRTLLAIFILTGIACICLKLYLENINIKKVIKISCVITVIIVILYLIYNFDIFGVKQYISNSPLTSRLNGEAFLETPRTDIIRDFFSKWMGYPNGGYKIIMLGNFKWTHNLWLDIYCATGIISFLLFMLYTVGYIKNLFKFIKKENAFNTQIKIMVFGLYVAFNLNFLVEPILENNPYYFMLFIMVNGSIDSLVKKYK